MGGCATKPKVAKEGDVYAKTPEPQPLNEDTVETKVVKKQEQSGLNLNVNENEIVHDDDQANKRRSLSLLFKENEDAKVSTENEKTVADETVKKETSEAEKPLEDAKHNEPTLKHESPKTEEQKLSQETKNNIEPATTKQESAVIVNAEEKSSLQNQSTDSAEKTVNTQTPPEAKKLSEETKINEPAEETVEKIDQNTNAGKVTVIMPEAKVAEKASSEIIVNEPMKQEQSSETTQIEDVVVPLPKEKVIDVVVTNAAESGENKAEEAKSSIEEKNHDGVEHTSKPSDAGSKIL